MRIDFTLNPDQNASGMTLGVLALGNIGGIDNSGLKRAKEALEGAMREKYGQMTRAELKSLHPMDVYISYYKKFGYTYHVLPQMESILRGKDIPNVLPPVAAMFMAELKNMLLTAGHDLDKIVLPLRLTQSVGNEIMPTLSGRDVATVQGDYMITDQKGVISAILRGCDARTAISETTKNVLYTVYVPAGIDKECIRNHLDDIEAYVRSFSKAPEIILKEIYST
jgi:DNA/RNA-binding domain of Phe-tRNA-synthetase-like protein